MRERTRNICKIDAIYDACEINTMNVSHVTDYNQRIVIEDLVNSYKPNKIRESDVVMKLLLKDEEPVYQSARRLSTSEKEIVNVQIDQLRMESFDRLPPIMQARWY